MTANYTVGNGFSGAISYCTQKEDAELIEVSNISHDFFENKIDLNISDASKQMREQAKERPRVKKPVMHVSFSFNKNENISDAKQLDAVKSGLKNVGIDLEKHQAVIVKHNDTNNPHYHVVLNRVDLQGDLHKDHRLMDRLQVSCDKVEKEMNLQKTKGRTVVYDPTNDKGFSYVKKEKNIQPISKNPKRETAMEEVLITYEHAKSVAVDIESLKKECLANKIEIKVSENKKGIYGVSFKDIETKEAFKGSALGIKAKELNEILPQNKKLEESRAVPEPQLNKSDAIEKSISDFKGAESDYLEKRKDYNSMIDRHTSNLASGKKSDVIGNDSDLVAIENEHKRIQKETEKSISDEKEKLKELENTPKKSVGLFNASKSKEFNRDLDFKIDELKTSIQEQKESSRMIGEMKLKAFSERLKTEKDSQLRGEMKTKQNTIQEQGKNNFDIDVVEEIKNREIIKQAEKREQNREQNKGRNQGHSM